MTVREEIVTSAVDFLQDPNVVSSSTESKLSFLRSKNLTQEEIDTAFARSGSSTSVTPSPSPPQHASNRQPYYGQYQSQPYGWQPPPPEPPKRDWRDWFIMATVVGGVGYGLYFMSKRYLYPLVSPPTPEKLEQDKATVDEQFEKAFATLEQLAKDTEELKASEKERTEKLDKVLDELDSFMRDTKSVGRRHEDETERLREEMKALKGVIPKSMTANKEFTDNRLKEITNEVKSLKLLISQRMNNASASASNSNPAPSPSPNPAPTSTPVPAMISRTTTSPPAINTNTNNPGANGFLKLPMLNPSAGTASGASSPGIDIVAQELGDHRRAVLDETGREDYMSALGGRNSPFGSGSGMSAQTASIPAWQRAAASASPATAAANADKDGGSNGNGSQQQSQQREAGSGS